MLINFSRTTETPIFSLDALHADTNMHLIEMFCSHVVVAIYHAMKSSPKGEVISPSIFPLDHSLL